MALPKCLLINLMWVNWESQLERIAVVPEELGSNTLRPSAHRPSSGPIDRADLGKGQLEDVCEE